MKSKYVKRTQFGLEAQIVESTNGSGYHSFKGGGIGGRHNYKEITRVEYLWLKTWYWVLGTILPEMYRKISKRSWDNGYSGEGYKQHAKKWGIKLINRR